MANYDPVCEWLLRIEDSTLAGIPKDLGDGAGITRFGLTSKNCTDLSAEYWTTMPTAQALVVAKAKYRAAYWNPIHGDGITADLVAAPLFSFFVNEGSQAIKEIQTILGLKADGVLGTQTLAAINQHNVLLGDSGRALGTSLRTANENYYRALVAQKPTDAQWLNGWVRRCWIVYP
jgi:lysozyme family protein